MGIIGTKGATVSELRKSSGCEIKAEPKPVGAEQVVHVTGPIFQVAAALPLLTPFVEEAGDSQMMRDLEYSNRWEGLGGHVNIAAKAAKGTAKGWNGKNGKQWPSAQIAT